MSHTKFIPDFFLNLRLYTATCIYKDALAWHDSNYIVYLLYVAVSYIREFHNGASHDNTYALPGTYTARFRLLHMSLGCGCTARSPCELPNVAVRRRPLLTGLHAADSIRAASSRTTELSLLLTQHHHRMLRHPVQKVNSWAPRPGMLAGMCRTQACYHSHIQTVTKNSATIARWCKRCSASSHRK